MVAYTVEEALAFLQKKSTSNGDTVFAHLSSLIQHILETRAEDVMDLLETSLLLKQTRFLVESGAKPTEVKDENEERLTHAFLELFDASTKPLPDPEMEPSEQQEPEEVESSADIADFLSESHFFEAVGVGLGRTETYFIVLALRQLGLKRGISKVRFFGKVFGIYGNYFIFETNRVEDDESKGGTEVKQLAYGRPLETIPPEEEGTNSHSYWVSSQLGGSFTRLPDVTPLQIQTARSVRKFLTGCLDEEVSAYPPFPGVEKNYLRAQIARISANTVIAPKGYFVPEELDEEDEHIGKIERNEEWSMPMPIELGNLEAWVHQNPHIKKQGRCSLYVPDVEAPKEGDEEVEQASMETEQEADQSPPLLMSLDNDEDVGRGKAWSISFSSSLKGLKYQVVLVRSLLWPGAYAVATNNSYSNVYIGWGVKNSPYNPSFPPEVQKEYAGELIEMQELPPVPRSEIDKEAAENEIDIDNEKEGEQGEEEMED